jgi:hypothetical protein
MKTKTLHRLLIVTILLSACSGVAPPPPPRVKAPAAQAIPASAAHAENSRGQTTKSTPAALPQTIQAPADQAISGSPLATQTSSSRTQTAASALGTGGGTPPEEAIAACTGKSAHAACEFNWQKGAETGICETVQGQLACSPQRDPAGTPSGQRDGSNPPQATPAREKGGQTGSPAGGAPPAEAIAACKRESERAICAFTWQKGAEKGICETVQGQLACSPQRDPAAGPQPDESRNRPSDAQGAPAGAAYNVEQAVSDKAQGMTIAFDALAYLTGDLGSDSFFPPGKVADFWGFQYLRDNDPSRMGHAGDFLTSAAMNVLNVLTADQRAQLVALAKNQVGSINEYGYMRFVLMDAFRRLLEGKLPAGTTGLSEDAVKDYSARLYRLDGEISLARAQLMGSLIMSMDATQRASLDGMVGKGMLDWPKVEEPSDIQGLDRDAKVAVMTYAADLFSWYAGSVDADVYFCPERHGTYFGSFYLKDRPAMSDPTYAIPTDLTGKMGDAMLRALTADQAARITGLVGIERPSLTGIVEVRKQVATELRKFKAGATGDRATVLGLMEEYGRLDGAIIYALALNFARVNQTLTSDQKAKLMAFRKEMLGGLQHPSGAYLYSQAIPMPQVPSTDFLFK